MSATIPGADVRTLSTLNQLLSLIQPTCRFDPAKLDWTSQQFTTFAWNNSRPGHSIPPDPAARALQRHALGLPSGLRGPAGCSERLAGPASTRRQASFFVGLAIEAAFVFCPDIADQFSDPFPRVSRDTGSKTATATLVDSWVIDEFSERYADLVIGSYDCVDWLCSMRITRWAQPGWASDPGGVGFGIG